jgi:hypothetical protein
MEKELRTAGERELAGRIKALRKPSVIAASLNAIVRANPVAVEELLAAVADLREAQEQLASDRKPDFARLQGEYRRYIQVLADLADESRRIETQAALEAAAIDTSLHDLLRTGTFADAPKPTGSFGVPIPSAGSVSGKSQPKKSPSGKSRSKKSPSGKSQSK